MSCSESVTRGRVLGRTLSIKRLSKKLLRDEASQTKKYTAPIPATWGECQARGLGTADSPCWFARCKYNLLLDVSFVSGGIKLNHPEAMDEHGVLDPRKLEETCVLRAAGRPLTLVEVGRLYNLCRERVRQIELKGLEKLASLAELARIQDEDFLSPLESNWFEVERRLDELGESQDIVDYDELDPMGRIGSAWNRLEEQRQ